MVGRFGWHGPSGGRLGRYMGAHGHDDAEAAVVGVGHAGVHLVGESEGGADPEGVGQVLRAERDDGWGALDHNGDGC